ncbi:hypothetical protein MtrunA17_Chr7g0224921 [Medicago truncatula]|uniref:Transmembrane protein n=1 Tax=Medicago truncatula TaxID=3880 RepID=A0A396H1E5_MEDTR|nr:hypothetical protein MtrunA17_Chr7g0224921 [Medicago truncatula]
MDFFGMFVLFESPWALMMPLFLCLPFIWPVELHCRILEATRW